MAGEQFNTIETRELVVSDKWSLKAALAPTATQTGWSVTNKSTDRTIDCDGLIAVLGDGLGTLIDDLIAKGILSA